MRIVVRGGGCTGERRRGRAAQQMAQQLPAGTDCQAGSPHQHRESRLAQQCWQQLLSGREGCVVAAVGAVAGVQDEAVATLRANLG
jgi:hypothetical protein